MYLNKKWEKLIDLNIFFYKYILELLDKDMKIVMASDFNLQGQKSDLVLDMCIKLKATKYIFGGEGQNYADKESFRNANIDLIFQDYKHPIYLQKGNKKNFMSHLSILDLIMNYDNNDLTCIILNND